MLRWSFSTAVLFVLSSGVTYSDESTDTSEDAWAIENAYNEWVEAANSKDIDRWSAFLAPNSVFLPPSHRPLETNEEIVEYYIALFQDPLFKLQCKQINVQVADSGELAWARGTCRGTFTDSIGEMQHGSSKWTKVWIRLSNGSWKCRLNTWNYDGGN